MEIVPVEEKMNQVAQAAPSEIGHVIESEIDTNEESTSSEITKDSDTLQHKENIEEYEAKGTAKIIGTQGKTTSSAEAKSKQSDSVTIADEGDRKGEITKKPPKKPPEESISSSSEEEEEVEEVEEMEIEEVEEEEEVEEIEVEEEETDEEEEPMHKAPPKKPVEQLPKKTAQEFIQKLPEQPSEKPAEPPPQKTPEVVEKPPEKAVGKTPEKAIEEPEQLTKQSKEKTPEVIEKPAERLPEKTVEEPTEKTSAQPSEKTAEIATDKTSEVIEKPTEKLQEEPSETPIEKAVKQPTQKTPEVAKKSQDKLVEKLPKETTEKPQEQPSEKPVEQPQEVPSEKQPEEAAKKTPESSETALEESLPAEPTPTAPSPASESSGTPIKTGDDSVDKPPIVTTTNSYQYKPLPPIKPFEPLKPFEQPASPSIKPFEPLKPFEPPKSFELTKKLSLSQPPEQKEKEESKKIIEQNNLTLKELEASLPEQKLSKPGTETANKTTTFQSTTSFNILKPTETMQSSTTQSTVTIEPPKSYSIPYETVKSYQSNEYSSQSFQSSAKTYAPSPSLQTYEPSQTYQSSEPPIYLQPSEPPQYLFEPEPTIQPFEPQKRFGSYQPFKSYETPQYSRASEPKPFQSYETPKSFKSYETPESFKPYDSLKSYQSQEPIKPYQSSQSFQSYESSKSVYSPQPPKPFYSSEPTKSHLSTEPTKSYQSTETTKSYETLRSFQSTPKPYQPNLEPLSSFTPFHRSYETSTSKAEIKDGKAKNTLKEIISEIDTYAERDKDLKDSVQGTGNKYSFQKYSESSSETYKYTQESSGRYSSFGQDSMFANDENAPKPINLEKIFTPAEDAPQIAPHRKDIFASSAFYAKGLHPTMEEQVELAKRISSSLSDVSNKTSKGQSMYINRKKRSVKWVHEGEGQANGAENGFGVEGSDENKPLLKLVMNPRGKVHDIYSLRKQGYNIESALSPEVCQEIVRDLNSPRGKGAELFAKRRKRSEKWVVGETEGTRPAELEDIAPPPTPKPIVQPVLPPTNLPTPGYLPETVQRVQHQQKLDQIQEQFVRPRVKLIKSPWDAALETGSVDAAFEDVAPVWPTKGNFVKPTVDSYEQAIKTNSLPTWSGANKSYTPNPAYNSNSINKMVDNFQKGVSNVDVYKPKLPQAWNINAPPSPQYKKPPSPLPPPPSSTVTPQSRPALVRTPSYKAEAPAAVFIPKENENLTPSYHSPLYNSDENFNVPQPPPRYCYSDFNNYNTAPRGWGHSKTYKPVSFNTPQYSDF